MDWENVLAQVLETICTLVVTVGLPCLVKIIANKVNNDQVNKLVEAAAETIEKCVITIDQTYVDALKKEGNFTKEMQEEAFENCRCLILNTLSEDAKLAIVNSCGDLETWIKVNIESYVRQHSSENSQNN